MVVLVCASVSECVSYSQRAESVYLICIALTNNSRHMHIQQNGLFCCVSLHHIIFVGHFEHFVSVLCVNFNEFQFYYYDRSIGEFTVNFFFVEGIKTISFLSFYLKILFML